MITLNAFTPTAVELTPAEFSLYGSMDRVRQATNAGIRRWVVQWRELLHGNVLDYGAGKPGTCRIPQPFRDLLPDARLYVPWEPGDKDLPLDFFDAILCTQVIQNVEHPYALFKRFRDMLKVGGRMVMTYPVAWEEIEQEYWRYTQKGLWLLCHAAGLRISTQETLVSIKVDGSLTLALVNGLVAVRES